MHVRAFFFDIYSLYFVKITNHKKGHLYPGRTDTPYQREKSESFFVLV